MKHVAVLGGGIAGLASAFRIRQEAEHAVDDFIGKLEAIGNATGGNAAIYYGLGVTEHSQGSTMVMAMANIAMATGNIGRFGVGGRRLCGLRCGRIRRLAYSYAIQNNYNDAIYFRDQKRMAFRGSLPALP